MMKYFTVTFSLTILLAFSLLCLYMVLWNPALLVSLCRTLPLLYEMSWGKMLMFALGFITLGCSLSLMALLIGFEPGSREPIILQTEAGSIGVSMDAIEEFIMRKGAMVHGVRDLHVHASVEEGGLVLSTKLILELQRNVPDFTREFQEKIHKELTETLGLTRIKEVRVMIKKIFPREAAKEPTLLSPPPQVLLKEPERTESFAEKTVETILPDTEIQEVSTAENPIIAEGEERKESTE